MLSEGEKLEEGHPDEAIVHSALGAVYYHQHNYQMAFRAFVFTMVMREQSPVLGERVSPRLREKLLCPLRRPRLMSGPDVRAMSCACIAPQTWRESYFPVRVARPECGQGGEISVMVIHIFGMRQYDSCAGVRCDVAAESEVIPSSWR